MMRLWKRPVVWVPTLVVGLALAWWLGSPLFLVTRADEPAPAAATPASSTPAPAPAAGAPSMAAPLPLTGTFTDGDSFHKASGTAMVIETAPGKRVLRFENFKVTNGPDLFVVLTEPDGAPARGVRLGDLKGSEGPQNYEIPDDLDLKLLSRVVIWCRAFNVIFGTAHLSGM
jgi:hypothetical protein